MKKIIVLTLILLLTSSVYAGGFVGRKVPDVRIGVSSYQARIAERDAALLRIDILEKELHDIKQEQYEMQLLEMFQEQEKMQPEIIFKDKIITKEKVITKTVTEENENYKWLFIISLIVNMIQLGS